MATESVLRTEDFKTYHNDVLKPKIQEITDAQTELEGTVGGYGTSIQANTAAITKLNGADTVDGSVKKTVKDAINTFAQQVTANETIDTFAEALQYIQEHGADYAELTGQVQNNTTNIGEVQKSVTALTPRVTAAETTIQTHTASISSLQGQVDTLTKNMPEYSTVTDVTSLTWN